jgi:hypothetical protein
MAKKSAKKESIRQQIISAAQIYSSELAGKVFLYVYGTEYFEVSFQIDQFLHLTGVDTRLSAKDFYRKARKGKLDSKQFFFTRAHPMGVAKKKLPCLNRLPDLTTTMVCILKDISTITMMYKLGITNLEFTLGLTENVGSQGNKINDYFLPRTLRVKDKAVDISQDGDIVDFIFVRDASKNTYEDILFQDVSKEIPDSISHLISPGFFD